jgi:CRP-like cAMP-binding protein
MGERDFSDRFLRIFGDGDVIFEEGSAGKHMYVIVSGSVRIVKKSEGEDAVIAALGKGELFGEMALVDSLPRSASAIAVGDDTSVVEIDHAQFAYLVGQQPAFALIILKALSLRLRDQMEIHRGHAGQSKGSRP